MDTGVDSHYIRIDNIEAGVAEVPSMSALPEKGYFLIGR